MKRIGSMIMILSIVFLVMSISPVSLAHSGRTDSSGGHKDNKNRSGLGYYHYHCGGHPPHLHPNGYCQYTDIFPSSVRITVESDKLRFGQSCPVTANVYPENACNTYVDWKSSDTNVVTVSSGQLAAVGYGTATITASAFNGVASSITITVPEIPVEAVNIFPLEESSKMLEIGGSLSLTAAITPADADRADVFWTSSDDSIATISDGVMYARKEGSVTITASTENGMSDSVEILVKEVVAERIDLVFPEEITIGETSDIHAAVYPANTSYPDIQWQSCDESILTVDPNGKLNALGVGVTTIRAIQKDITATAEIEVLPVPVEYIDMSHDKLEEDLGIGETLQFYANAYPSNATYPEIVWSTSDHNLAVIDENGLLTTIDAGDITVYARTADGTETSISLSIINKSIPLYIGSAGGAATLGTVAVWIKKRKKL